MRRDRARRSLSTPAPRRCPARRRAAESQRPGARAVVAADGVRQGQGRRRGGITARPTGDVHVRARRRRGVRRTRRRAGRASRRRLRRPRAGAAVPAGRDAVGQAARPGGDRRAHGVVPRQFAPGGPCPGAGYGDAGRRGVDDPRRARRPRRPFDGAHQASVRGGGRRRGSARCAPRLPGRAVRRPAQRKIVAIARRRPLHRHLDRRAVPRRVRTDRQQVDRVLRRRAARPCRPRSTVCRWRTRSRRRTTSR